MSLLSYYNQPVHTRSSHIRYYNLFIILISHKDKASIDYYESDGTIKDREADGLVAYELESDYVEPNDVVMIRSVLYMQQ